MEFELPKHPEINSINLYNIDFQKLSFEEFSYLLSKELQLRYKPQILYYQRILAEYLILENMNDLAEPISIRIFEPDQKILTNDEIVEVLFKWVVDHKPSFTGMELIQILLAAKLEEVRNLQDARFYAIRLLEASEIIPIGEQQSKFDIHCIYYLRKQRLPELEEGKIGTNSLYVWGNNVFSPKLIPVTGKICSVCCGSTNVVMLSASGIVFSWGEGKSGQLGLGNLQNVNTPTEIKNFRGKVVSAIYASQAQVAAIVKNGNLTEFYHWGWNGFPIGNEPIHLYAPVFEETEITSVTMGSFHTAVIAFRNSNSRSSLYTWGTNKYGELGHGDFVERNYPQKVDIFEYHKILAIASGDCHMLVVNDNYDLWVWGKDIVPLNNDQRGTISTPTRFETPEKFCMVACGGRHNLAISKSGDLFAWGDGKRGRLGTGDEEIRLTPVKISNIRDVLMIRTGNSHSAVVTENGICTFGDGNLGKLGHGNDNDCLSPKYLDIPSQMVLDISCGTTITAAIVVDDPLKILKLAIQQKFGNSDEERAKLLEIILAGSIDVVRHQTILQNEYLRSLNPPPLNNSNSSLSFTRTSKKAVPTLAPQKFQIQFSKNKLDFESLSVGVFRYLNDNMTISNPSAYPVQYTFSCPKNDKYNISIKPKHGTIPKNDSKLIEVEFIIFEPGEYQFLIHCDTEWQVGEGITPQCRTLLWIDLKAEGMKDAKQYDYSKLAVGTVIGSGATGVVSKVDLNGEVVAVKKFIVSTLNKEEVDLLQREILLSNNLRNPYIVQCKGMCLQYPNVCLILEYCHLGDLRSFMSRLRGLRETEEWGESDITFLLKIAYDISMGMKYLHSCRIIHRDLKLDNIMMYSMDMNAEVNAKVADFGTSIVQNQKKTVTANFGTPRYLPPEVLIGMENSNEKIDVYSFAFLMWELFAGKIAFGNLDFYHQIHDAVVGRQRPSMNDKIPNDVAQLIRQCWDDEPRKRPNFTAISQSLLQSLIYRKYRPKVAMLKAEWKFRSIKQNSSPDRKIFIKNYSTRKFTGLDLHVPVEPILLDVKNIPPEMLDEFNKLTADYEASKGKYDEHSKWYRFFLQKMEEEKEKMETEREIQGDLLRKIHNIISSPQNHNNL